MPKPDWSGGVGGAVSGAASGAYVGSIGGPIGTAVGAGLGFLGGGASGLFGGKKKKKKGQNGPNKLSTLDPQQQQLYDQYVSSLRGEGPFSNLYNYDTEGANANFDANVSRPAYRNFQENIIPGITGQFRGGNLGRSSYVGESLSRAGRDVQEGLDAQRSNMIFQGQQQANMNKQNAINNILGTQTFSYEKPEAKTPSTIDQILGSLGPAAGEWLADYFKKAQTSATAPSAPAAA